MAVSLDDWIAVQDLLGRYCWYFDEGMGPEWASLYTEDGIFEGTRPEPTVGHAALAQAPVGSAAHFKGRIRHQFGNVHFEEQTDPNRLVAKFYNQVSTWGMDNGNQLLMLAICTAQLVREGAGAPWRIARNTIRVLK
ncbi:nuclear transport factor 2 family protein [Novosphingobium bradum]|uniref:Nuclear transport factor 2 family protein n=1 Tax=Novosphingobium bradum TaxID=1737444 RepID=A0ABV7IML1_9SPHN